MYQYKQRDSRLAVLMAYVAATMLTFGQGIAAADPTPWRFFGADTGNTRANISEYSNIGSPTQINPRTAPKLKLKWSTSTIGDISATPTVEAGGLYFPDYAGYVYKLDPDSGRIVWSKYLGSYMDGFYGYSRSSPAIGALGEIIVGNNSPNGSSHPGARLFSIDRGTGALKWASIMDPSPYSYVTESPVIYDGRIYVGLTTNEFAIPTRIPGYKVTFRGRVVCLDEATGKVLWEFYTVPPGYSGASVWGSSPVVFTPTHSLIVGTGNNYSVPDSVLSCYKTAGSNLAAQYRCMDPSNFVDSILALDLVTGKLNWARRFGGEDTWNEACSLGPPSGCPSPAGPDIDFGQAPNLSWVPDFVGVADDRGGHSNSYMLGAGEKSGHYWAINPFNGGLYWSAFVGRGELLWGSAVNTDDHNAFYVALMNSAHFTNELAGQDGHSFAWNAGSWASIDLRSGKFNWQVKAVGQDVATPGFGGAAPGPVTFTNRVVFGGSTSGYFVGLDANSGNTLWSYDAGGSIIGGPSIYNETLYWGAGAKRSGPGTVHRMFAFSIPAP